MRPKVAVSEKAPNPRKRLTGTRPLSADNPHMHVYVCRIGPPACGRHSSPPLYLLTSRFSLNKSRYAGKFSSVFTRPHPKLLGVQKQRRRNSELGTQKASFKGACTRWVKIV